MIIPVIMAGGAGTRLWPMSREEKPKQFHNLSGHGTLLEETIGRLKTFSPEEVVIVSSGKYEDLSLGEIKRSGLSGTVLSEPMAKNTAAAVLYGAIFLQKKYEDSVMIILPADHFIKKPDKFTDVLKKAVNLAQKGSLVTIGIKPEYPETGYGYIKAEDNAQGDELPVDRFVEKPDLETAEKYVESGNYFWNSGIFVWKTSVIIEKFKELMPAHYEAFSALAEMTPEEIASSSGEAWKLKEKIFSSLESVSIDNGILEHASNRVVIPSEFGWADILDPDDDGNRSPEADNSIFVNSGNCSVFSEGMRIAVVGASNLVVVQAGNDILVIDKDSSQDVRKVVDIIKKRA